MSAAIELAATDADVTVSASANITHRCPFVDETDHGIITITWRTNGSTIELHSLRAYLNAHADEEISHEELTDRVRHHLSTLPGVELISVTSEWVTSGMEVSCSTSPTPVGQL